MDKVSMSLDDIIKLNRNGPRRNNRGKGPQIKGFGNQPRNQMPQKKLGMLNKSKGINKQRRLNNNRQNGGGGGRIGGKAFGVSKRPNMQRRQQIKNKFQKRKLSNNLKSRLSNTKPVNRPNNNRIRNPNGNNSGVNRQPIRANRQQPPRRAENKTNLAMQIAKKNVQKAKRLLANRISKVKELSSRLGNRNSKIVKRQKPVNRAPRIKRLGNPNSVKVNVKNRVQNNRRNRAGQQKGRMVLY